MKKLILGFVVCALMAAPALANITIINPDAPPSAPYTYTLYDFTKGQQGQGDGPFSIDYNVWKTNIQGIGAPLPLVATLTYPGEYMNGSYDGYVYGVHDVHISIPWIPNLYNPDLVKLVQVEIEYWVGDTGGLDGYSIFVPAGNVSLVQDPDLNVRNLGNGFYDVTWTWKVWPQPEWEAISFVLLGSNGITAESVEVATVCIPIPAPAAVILGGIGTALVGWLRRRRSL